VYHLPLAAGAPGRLTSARCTTLGRSAAQNSFPGSAFTLSDRRSDSYSALRACGGSHQVLRTSPSGPLRGAGKQLLAVVQSFGQATPVRPPPTACKQAAGAPSRATLPRPTCPPHLVCREPGLRPQRAFSGHVAFGSCLSVKTRRLPHQAAAWTGAAPPQAHHTDACRCAPSCVRMAGSRHPLPPGQPGGLAPPDGFTYTLAYLRFHAGSSLKSMTAEVTGIDGSRSSARRAFLRSR
jgi:hypothetical protein